MALKAVNLVPGSGSEIVSPTDPIAIGLRSETLSVDTGKILVQMGYTGVLQGTVLPELDSALNKKVESLELETVERRSPASVGVSRAMVGPSLVLTKTSNSPNDQCIYAIKSQVSYEASALGYVKFRTNTAWQTQSPDWLDQTSVVCPYIGLEHGQHNTACYAFLRKTGLSTGEIIVGGPLAALNQARPGETPLASTDWAALPDDSVVEMWIYFNQFGYRAPYSPPNVPTVEVWVKFPSDSGPVVKHTTVVGSFGTFPGPNSNFSNYRNGPDDQVTMFIGNAGKTGDALKIDEWALYPDFRKAVEEGIPFPNHLMSMVSDLRGEYLASEGKLPTEAVPGRWVPVAEWGTVEQEMAKPGWSDVPTQVVMTKSVDTESGVERAEPRIGQQVDGFVVEAYMSASQSIKPVDQVFGAGFGVDDGSKLYQVVTVTSPVRTLGLSGSLVNPNSLSSCYPAATEIDWRSRKLVRMTVDRHRAKVSVEVDDKQVLEVPTSNAFPPTVRGSGRIYFGHLLNVEERGELSVNRLRYFQRYKAWEAVDGDLPPAAAVPFTLTNSGSGTTDAITPGDAEMIIRKTDVSSAGSKRFYVRSETLPPLNGLYLDVGARVITFKAADGTLMTPYNWTGSGVKVNFGSQSFTLGFFECGPFGKKIGIIPGSGTIDDILHQTALGKKFSTACNWLEPNRIRLVYQPGRSIDVYVSSTILSPSISIPWLDAVRGFDIPADVTSPSVEFGHFDENLASTTAWSHVRFGQGNGQDLAITQQFPEGLKSHHFGGKALVLISAGEI